MERKRQNGHRHNIPAARILRDRETNAESLLWTELRGRRLLGLEFRRQHPVGPCVLDFCCTERRLEIEIDSGIHESQRDRDAERTAMLNAAGYRVIRFSNDVIMNHLPEVLNAIESAANGQPLWRPSEPGRHSGWRERHPCGILLKVLKEESLPRRPKAPLPAPMAGPLWVAVWGEGCSRQTRRLRLCKPAPMAGPLLSHEGEGSSRVR